MYLLDLLHQTFSLLQNDVYYLRPKKCRKWEIRKEKERREKKRKKKGLTTSQWDHSHWVNWPSRKAIEGEEGWKCEVESRRKTTGCLTNALSDPTLGDTGLHMIPFVKHFYGVFLKGFKVCSANACSSGKKYCWKYFRYYLSTFSE